MAEAPNPATQSCEKCGTANAASARYCLNCGNEMSAEGLVGQIILGRYEVKSVLGEGGMGRVYIAEQKLGTAVRRVAAKTLHSELSGDPQIVARFQRECETIVGLKHPNTVQVYDFGELDDGTLVIVMEYIPGRDLAQVIEEEGALDPGRVTSLIVQICGSLQEAHDNKVVHRDLKPENILLTKHGEDDFVKVVDFGIAKQGHAEQRTTQLTQKGAVLGTPPYMSPEQFGAEEIDQRSDIYSLGIVAYEMLTGRLPYEAQTAWEWATKHLTGTPLPITEAASQPLLPQQIAAVTRALSRNADDRQRSAKEFMQEFMGQTGTPATWALATSGVSMRGSYSDDEISVGFANTEPPPKSGRGKVVALGIVSFLVVLGIGLAALTTIFKDADDVVAERVDTPAKVEVDVAEDPTTPPDKKVEKESAPSEPGPSEPGPSEVVAGAEPPKVKPVAPAKTTSKRSKKRRKKKRNTPKITTSPAVVAASPAQEAALKALRAALAQKQLTKAVVQLGAAKRAGASAAALAAPRKQIGALGARQIGNLMVKGDCSGAQSLYRTLRRASADLSAANKQGWAAWCERP